jgi:hypothetical protein
MRNAIGPRHGGHGHQRARESPRTDTMPDDNAPPMTLPAPRQSSAVALAFLAGLGRREPLLFRAIFDDKDAPKRRVFELFGTFEQHMHQLRRLNDAGYGVFVQICMGDGKGGKTANITGATCFFADFDGTPLENVARLGLPPHVEVETSWGKRHFYWRVEGIPLDQFSIVQKRIIRLFGSDAGVNDLARIMRMPGYLHMKNPAAPRLVQVLRSRPDAPYSFDAFLAVLDAAEREHGIAGDKGEDRGGKGAGAGTTGSGRATAYPPDLAFAEEIIRFLITHPDGIDIGDRNVWMRIAIVLHEHGEPGFAVFLAISRSHASFDGEGPCRVLWDSIKDDRPDGAKLTIGTYVKMAKDLGWKGKHPGGGAGGDGGDDEQQKVARGRPDPASLVLEQANDAGDERFLDPKGRPHVRYRRTAEDGAEWWSTARIESKIYRAVIDNRFFAEHAKALPPEQLNSAIRLMEAEAYHRAEQRDVYLRVAETPNCTYVDLGRGDGRAIAVTAEGWQVIVDPPVNFFMGSRGALPLPETGGTLELFERHFNLSPDDVRRSVGFLIGTFHPTQAQPLLMICGEAGSAKSNLADKHLALTDPPRGEHHEQRHGMSTDERNLHVHAARCHVLLLDNISNFTGDVADQLCRLSTGGASSSRQHHTMDEEYEFAVRRAVIFTCISAPSTRTDLLSRSLRVDAQRIVRRRSEEAVWREYRMDSGKMLGFLMDGVSAALRNKDAVEARVDADELRLPRMGDFGQFVEGAAEVLGLAPGEFATLLNDEQAAVQAQAVEGNPLVEGLMRYFSQPDAEPLNATAAELRTIISKQLPHVDLPPKNKIKDALNRIMQGLRDSGIDVVCTGKANRAKVDRFTVRTNENFEPIGILPSDDRDEMPF